MDFDGRSAAVQALGQRLRFEFLVRFTPYVQYN